MSGAALAINNNERVEDDYHRALHERLTRRAKLRVGLEAEEARDLVLAEEAGLHRFYGYVSILEYMERELHYGPHAAKERLRVANELFLLPKLAKKFRAGELPFSVMREVTRVAVPENEEDWLAVVEGKTAREVERMVSGLGPIRSWRGTGSSSMCPTRSTRSGGRCGSRARTSAASD